MTFTCQLCGESGKDTSKGADILPWGATCADCLKLIEKGRA